MIAKFIANPKQAPDTSCTSKIKPPSFSVDAMTRFGQASLWDNAAP
jgi:hypothetical protein